MPVIKAVVFSIGTGTARGNTFGPGLHRDPLQLRNCTVEKLFNQVTLEFNGTSRKYDRASIEIPIDLAKQIAKVILSEAEGLWDKWTKDFPEETAG